MYAFTTSAANRLCIPEGDTREDQVKVGKRDHTERIGESGELRVGVFGFLIFFNACRCFFRQRKINQQDDRGVIIVQRFS